MLNLKFCALDNALIFILLQVLRIKNSDTSFASFFVRTVTSAEIPHRSVRYLMKTRAFQHVKARRMLNRCRIFERSNGLGLTDFENEGTRTFKTLVTLYHSTSCNISEDLSLYLCDKLVSGDKSGVFELLREYCKSEKVPLSLRSVM